MAKKKTVSDVASEGGKARAEALSPEERADIARRAAEKRWQAEGKAVLRATHIGEITIGSVTLPCAVLEDGTRVLSQRGMLAALGRTGRATGIRDASAFNLPPFLAAKNLKPFISNDLLLASAPIRFRPPAQGKSNLIAFGYRGEILPLICQVFLEAAADGALNNKQLHILEQCKSLGKGFAILGITALIDEATGYQEIRDRRALQAILDKFLLEEHAKWAKRFPDEFYQQIFRLRGWEWKGMKINRPGVVAAYTKDLVYARLAPGVLQELERLNPIEESGRRAVKHHQFLTPDIGHPALQAHLIGIIAILRGSQTWAYAMKMVQRSFPKVNTTFDLPFPEPEDSVTPAL